MPDQTQSYVDEAGDPTLFGSKRGRGGPGGTYFKGEQDPTAETAFPRKHEQKKKMPQM